MRKLLNVLRRPFTFNAPSRGVLPVVSDEPAVLTPVVSSASAEYSRARSGRARVWSPVMTCPRSLESVSISGDAAVTSTFSLTCPTGICRSTRSRAPTCTRTFSTIASANPVFSAVTT